MRDKLDSKKQAVIKSTHRYYYLHLLPYPTEYEETVSYQILIFFIYNEKLADLVLSVL